MAKYHKNLHYHEDKINKHKITEEELSFLRELQKEMNTQNDCGLLNPIYWVIIGSEKIYRTEEADGYELWSKDDCCSVAYDLEDICKYINDNFLDDIEHLDGKEYTITIEEMPFGSDYISVKWIEDGEEEEILLQDSSDIVDWLDEHGINGYDIISYQIVQKIYHNTMFLTQKDAEEHLRENAHHYSEDAHTFAMRAWRSPRITKLIEILQTVDFNG